MRSRFLDALRGSAVIWMIIFHAAYDLRALNYVDWDFSRGFWFGFPRFIAFTFLYCVGVALNFVHKDSIKWPAVRTRALKLGGAAALISISTYFVFPQGWIFFGTLHCIFIGSALGVFFVNHRRAALALLLLIVFLQYVAGFDIKWVVSIIQRPSMDFIPIYPWFWVILLGILTGPYLSKSRRLNQVPLPGWLDFLGRHSLPIYLVHQPVIYGVLWLSKALF